MLRGFCRMFCVDVDAVARAVPVAIAVAAAAAAAVVVAVVVVVDCYVIYFAGHNVRVFDAGTIVRVSKHVCLYLLNSKP